MTINRNIAAALIVVAFLLTPIRAFADCTNPADPESTVIYNTDYHKLQYCNGTQWIAAGGGSNGGMTLISTQTASSSASLQFTSLPTTYNTLFLNCTGLLGSSGGAILYWQVGEGATPTWETGAHYTATNIYANGGTPASVSTTTGTDLTNAGNNLNATTPISSKMYIDNSGSSSAYKVATYQQALGGYIASGFGYWNNDKSPITGIQLVTGSGTITSGTCSLYGIQ